jgi:endonuclease/exonuclease/phosphatase family metal-dependent hydrolase
MKPYTKRLPKAISLINELELSVIGFQELEEVQWQLYKELTGKKWAFWPGNRLGRGPVRNSMGWRRSVWKRVERHTYEVPYFHGNPVRNPYVKLRHRATGREVWFLNTHNPADARGPAARWRRQSLRTQARLVNRLEATGRPVVFTGDFNDREKALCPLTRMTDLRSANGGGWRRGTCEVPRYSRIDYIFHSRRLRSTDYQLREGRAIDRITDHPVITARIALPRR